MSDRLPFAEIETNLSESNNAQLQELNDVKEFLKIKHSKYIKYKILYDAVQECASDSSNLDIGLKAKIEEIVLSQSCAQVLSIESEGFNEESSKLLGISCLNEAELKYGESLKLKKTLVNHLQDTSKSIRKSFAEITNESIDKTAKVSTDSLNFHLEPQDRVLLEFSRKLSDQKEQFLQNLLKQQEVLEDIIRLRLEHLPQICDEKIKESQIKSHMNVLRTEIVKAKTKVDIFMETNNSLLAYEEIMKDIKKQQEECHSDIEDLEKLKEKYHQVACKPFDELLKLYIQYKTLLAKKRRMYDILNN